MEVILTTFNISDRITVPLRNPGILKPLLSALLFTYDRNLLVKHRFHISEISKL